MVLRHVSLGLSSLLLLSTLYCIACLGTIWYGILWTWPYHLHLLLLSSSTMDLFPVLRMSSFSLTLSNHYFFIIFLKHPNSNIPSHFSISFRPFHGLQLYASAEITTLWNSFNFVQRDMPFSFHTFNNYLKVVSALPNLISISFRIPPSFRSLQCEVSVLIYEGWHTTCVGQRGICARCWC